MVVGVFSALAVPSAAMTPSIPRIADVVKKDIGPEYRAWHPGMDEILAAAEASGIDRRYGPADVYDVGDTELYYVGTNGLTDYIEFEKRAQSPHVEFWVATDLSYPAGDPRNNNLENITIYDWEIAYVIGQFEDVILPIESEYFGAAPFHDGSNSKFEHEGLPFFNDAEGRLMIMVWNIVDSSYYDSTYPSYVAGMFGSTSWENYDRNIINLDSWNWVDRIGPDVPRPFVYESTIAHEYQHLLHASLDIDEVAFVDEGCAMYSEVLCGYGEGNYGYYQEFLYTPDNSLTEWGDQGDINILADYGAAAMFTIYLSDHFGGAEVISALAHNQANGREGVNAALAAAGYEDWDFNRVFEAWRLANLIHSDDFGKGLYNYDTINLNDPRAGELTVQSVKPGMGFVTQSYAFQYTYTYDGYNTLTYLAGAYGTDYLNIKGVRAGELLKLKFKFDGNDDYAPAWRLTPSSAYSGFSGNVWYSGTGDLRDVFLTGTADLSGMQNAVLAFDTYYVIEEAWDFGFVQVSTDGGVTWTSLANEFTRSDIVLDGHPDIAANMPGLTGSGSGHMEFNLKDYVGSKVMIAFRYMTDWSYTDPGWFVDNIAINGVVVDNGDNIGSFSSDPPVKLDFMVTIYAPAYSNGGISLPYKMETLKLDDDTETALYSLAGYSGYRDIYILISPDGGPTNYKFGLVKA